LVQEVNRRTEQSSGGKFDRRTVLRAGGIGIAGGALAVVGAGFFGRFGRGPRVLDFTLNPEAVQAIVDQIGIVDGPIPEYRKCGALVVLPGETVSVHALSGRTEEIDNSATIADVTAALPDDAWLLPPYCLWNQDPLTTVIHNGALCCVLPKSPPHYSPFLTADSLTAYLKFFFEDVEIIRAPFDFEGGDLRFDEVGGERIAFGNFLQVDEESVRQVFRVDRGIHLASNVLLRGTGIHLDELFIFLGNHTVGLVKLTPPGDFAHDDELRRLEHDIDRIRDILGNRLGYTVLDLPTSWIDFAASCTFSNCLQFSDRDGRRHILVPDYGNLHAPHTFEHVLNVYRGTGAAVHPVRIATAAHSGGLHCLTNVLL